MMQKTPFFIHFWARGALGWLKLDEIDAANSFLMLLMPRNCLKSLFFCARGALGGLKLDEIDATNSFLMLLMAR